MMKTLFENEHIRINHDSEQKIVEVTGKQVCDDLQKIKQVLCIIKQYVKDASAEKIIFKLEGFNTVGDDAFIYDELFPYLGRVGVKHLAVITGQNRKSKVFFEELGQYLSPVRKQYHIESKQFETADQCFRWLGNDKK
jgi:hypothetical protein